MIRVTDTGESIFVGGLIGRNEAVRLDPRDTLAGADVVNCSVFGVVRGDEYVGGLIGYHWGSTILQCSSTCTVFGSHFVGGLCGGTHQGTITSCFSGSEIPKGNVTGGLCGLNEFGTIAQCYSTGRIGEGYNAGGLCGNNEGGEITDCYSTAELTGLGSGRGGLCGFNGGIITNGYAAGAVTGTPPFGGLCGISVYDVGNFLNCFWDMETSGVTQGVGSIDPDPSGVAGLSTEQMTQRGSFTGWDFAGEQTDGSHEIWRMCEDGIQYPKLSWEYGRNGDFACPDGTGMEDMALLSANWLLSAADNPSFNTAADGSGDGRPPCVRFRPPRLSARARSRNATG